MGHYGIYTTRLCQKLSELGHRVVLCSNRVFPEKYLERPPLFEIVEVNDGRWSFESAEKSGSGRTYWYAYYRNSFLITSAAMRLARRRKFDGIFITDAEFMVASLVLKTLGRGLPPVAMQVSAANFSFDDYRGSVAKKIYKVLQREILRSTLGREIRAVSVLGEWHREQLIDQLRLNQRCPAVVTGDGGSAVATIPKAKARDALGIKYEGPLLLFFGMLRRDKGIESLFKAVALAREQNFKLLVAGHPSEYAESDMTGEVQRLGIGDKVILRLGYVPEEQVGLHFSSSDALLLPYASVYRDGSGPLMKGACAYGVPVLATDVAEMGRLVSLHRLGLLSKPDDPQSLADNIIKFLMLNAEQRMAMGEAAAALGRANSWEALASRFSDLFYDMKRRVAIQ